MMHRFRAFIFLIALLWAGHAYAQREVIPLNGYSLRAYFALGEKYESKVPADSLSNWMDSLCLAILMQQDPPGNLFAHQGGGPRGAEWNSDADIVLVWAGPVQEAKLKHVTIRLNGKVLKASDTRLASVWAMENGTMADARLIPAHVWMAALRPPKPGDKDYAFSTAAAITPDIAAAVKVLDVQVVLRKDDVDRRAFMRRAFAWAGGE